MQNKKDTIWITIPDEQSPSAETAPESQDRVENKAFWGAGFIALIAFSIILFAPQQFTHLMQAQLFDGEFQVVPDFEEQGEELQLDPEAEETAEEEVTEEEVGAGEATDNVVEAESEAVSIQIEPLEETGEEIPEEAVEEEVSGEEEVAEEAESTEVVDEAEPIEVEGAAPEEEGAEETEEAPSEEGAEEGEETEEEAETDLDLLQALMVQIEELKERDRQNNQQIQDLMDLLEAQAAAGGALRGSAGEQAGGAGLPGTQPGTQLGQPTSPGTYRYNTHTVTISPYDVLAQNRQVQQLGQQQLAVQASVTGASIQPYSNQNFNPVLSTVQAQPDTGPAESMMVALLVASFGVLAWGILRSARA